MDLKQLPGLKNKNGDVHYCFKVEFNFSKAGNATANKMTAKELGETLSFRFHVKNQFEQAVMQGSMSAKF